MSNSILLDDIGPQSITHFYDPILNFKAVLVIDTYVYPSAIGGVRMLPDITTEEIIGLARAMTYKTAIFNFPLSGAKAGIWSDPKQKGAKRKAILTAFGKQLKPFLTQNRYVAGPDMGTYAEDFQTIYKAAGLSYVVGDLFQKQKDGEPLENHLTGYGVVISAQAACRHVDTPFKNATIAIEGFGKVGVGIARYADKAGAKIVAVSTTQGAIYNKNGLNVDRLFENRRKLGGKLVEEYEDAQKMAKEDLFHLPVDILVLGARPHVINENNVNSVRAKVIANAANNPITSIAEETLFKKGIVVPPDFVSNAGGIIGGIVSILRGSEKQAFESVKNLIETTTEEILRTAKDEKINPKKLAINRTTKNILEMRSRKKSLSMESILEIMRKLLNLN